MLFDTEEETTGVPVLDELGGVFVQGKVRDLLLSQGVAFPHVSTAPLHSEMLTTPKECFKNAAVAVMRWDHLTYVEGFAFCDVAPFPVAHAWVVNEDQEVIDSTWPNPGSDYFGVPLPTEDLVALISRSGEFGVLDLLWREQWARDHFNL